MKTMTDIIKETFHKVRGSIVRLALKKQELGIIDVSTTLTSQAFIVDLRVVYKGEQGMTIYFYDPIKLLSGDYDWRLFDMHSRIDKAQDENQPLLRITRIVFNACTTLQKGHMDHLLGKRIFVNVKSGGEID